VLAHFGVRQLVIAHTPVPRAQARYDGAVMAVNVNDNSATPSVLRYEGETPRVEDIGVPRRLVDNPSVHARPLDLTSDADRALLKRTMVAMQDLAALPQPY
jgi:hypothetical protein